jgi:hypothetical protein
MTPAAEQSWREREREKEREMVIFVCGIERFTRIPGLLSIYGGYIEYFSLAKVECEIFVFEFDPRSRWDDDGETLEMSTDVHRYWAEGSE